MLQINNLTFTYPDAKEPALQIDHLHIPPGSFTLVTGRSGAGKSTFLRLANGLVPYFSGGIVSGSILINGINPLEVGPQVMSGQVGFVFQEPENQFVVDCVEDEIVFSMENAAIPSAEMERKLEGVLKQLDIESLRYRKVHSLSGGEAQRVAIAAALVLQPKLLVLDEPTSQLDPASAQKVLSLLERIRNENGITILIAEHRLERILHFCTHLLHLSIDQPKAIFGTPREVILKSDLQPPIIQLARQLNWQPLPMSVEEAKAFAVHFHPNLKLNKQPDLPSLKQNSEQPILSMQDLTVSYGTNTVLKDVNLRLNLSERLVIIGPNGAGKSTLLRSIIGLIKPTHGSIILDGQSIENLHSAEICRTIGFLPQDPNALLFSETVSQELETTLLNHKLPVDKKQIENLLNHLLLKEVEVAYPRDLSTGERQRVALGAIAITNPKVLILDEPTRGLDPLAKMALVNLLKSWNKMGITILMVTHDIELAASFASRIVILEEGQIIADGTPQIIFHQFTRYQTQIAQLFPDTELLTVKDLELGEQNTIGSVI